MISRAIYKKHNLEAIKCFTTYRKPPKPNNDYTPIIIVALMYSIFDTGQDIYKAYNNKKI